MKFSTTKLTPFLIAAAVVLLVSVFASVPGSLPGGPMAERLEAMTYDWRVRLATQFSPPVATNLGFIYIDETSIDAVNSGDFGYQHGLYWPRHVYGRLVRELTAQRAKLVAFDVLFVGLRPDHAPVTESNRPPIGSDEFFALQNKRHGHVVLAAARDALPPPLFHENTWMLGHIDADKDDGVLRRVKPYADYRDWHELIRQFARMNGVDLSKVAIDSHRLLLERENKKITQLKLDAQGRFNLYDLADKPDPKLPDIYEPPFVMRRVWATGIVMASHELKLDLKNPELAPDGMAMILHGAAGVSRRIPLDADGYFFINWTMSPSHPSLKRESINGLLESDMKRHNGENITDHFRDKLVIIGSTAAGNDLSDMGDTPLEKSAYLVSKHWNVANSIITNQFVQRSSLGVNLAIILALGLISTFVTWRLRAPWGTVCLLFVALSYVSVAAYAYVHQRYWLPVLLPSVGALLFTHGALVSYQVIFEQREKRRVKGVFSKLVSPNVVNELLSTDKLNFGGARREITVLFADVRGFTQLTDQNQEAAERYVREHNLTGEVAETYFDAQAQETLATVNLYLSTIADQIKKHEGTLDKYIGDCVMAFWGAPTLNERHAVNCVKAAFDAQRAMHAVNQKRNEENKVREKENPARIAAGLAPLPMHQLLALGTGINSGVAIVGLMGSDAHILNYTVFGREVNIASRLEGVSGRGRIIIGDSTYKSLLKHDPVLAATCVEQPPVSVKGIKEPVNIYEVPWRLTEAVPTQTAKVETPALAPPKA